MNKQELARINQAVELIRQGEVVVMPTETVYGLAANAFDAEACAKIFALKGRPAHNPLIVHVASIEDAEELAELSEEALLLTKAFWPGPLTIVLPKKKDAELSDVVTANLETVALRMPAHKTALELLERTGVPLAAPSANKSGKLSPTYASHSLNDFAKEEVFVIEGDASKYGLESTIIDLSTETPTILRYGFITPESIKKILGKDIVVADKDSKVKAPGMLLRHYAPRVALRLDAIDIRSNEVGLDFGELELGNKYGNKVLNLSAKGDLAEAASNLFDYLHRLDKHASTSSAVAIAVSPIPEEGPEDGIGLAINDRLRRGAAV